MIYSTWQTIAVFLALASIACSAAAQPGALRLEILHPETNSIRARLRSTVHSNAVLRLQASTNLAAWETLATLHDKAWDYPDLSATQRDRRFYRATATPRGSTDDWKNQVRFPSDPFRSSYSESEIGWVKFAILLSEPDRVVYQDSRKFLLHYDFATQRLAPFRGLGYGAFEAVSLHRAQQQVVLGSVLYPPGVGAEPDWWFGHIAEVGIQFDGLDPYPPEDIARWFQLVKATVDGAAGAATYYMPAFEQSELARTNAAALENQGVRVGSPARWVLANSCYAPGWAYGSLEYFTAAQITPAFRDGRLRPEDILLTDGVPADTPLVAGLVSLTPSTPNSHTAILCRSYGVPFAYLSDSQARVWAQGLVGRKVLVRASFTLSGSEVKIIDLDNVLSAALESDLRSLKSPDPIDLLPKRSYGSFWASTDSLVPADIQFFGGKAAHYSMLRRYVPSHCQAAIAFSFDLWDGFLDQVLAGGATLRAEIAMRLAPHTGYPPNMATLTTDLAGIRDLFTQSARFSPALQRAVTNALAGFDPRRKIRFRSSTNVEDSEHFSGAGLYDSYSGCLLDDLDGDATGPCQCDPAEPGERGVFRALQKVYASFYNDDAYLQRLMHGIDESKVGMGVLVHYSFPDEAELANGVATPRFEFTAGGTRMTGELVTQSGATSVTNPDGTAVPEVVTLSLYNPILSITQWSSLLPLGASVLDWPSEYETLVGLFSSVAAGFRQSYPERRLLNLDFEYKKDAQLGLVLKQVRPIPQPAAALPRTAVLVDEPIHCEIAQYGSVFANHRLKSRWTLRAPSMALTPAALAQGIYGDCSLEFVENGTVKALTGPMNGWPDAIHSTSGSVNSWTTDRGSNAWHWQLETGVTPTVTGSQLPIVTLADFSKRLTVAYPRPMPQSPWSPLTNLSESVALQLQPQDDHAALLQTRRLVKTNLVTIETSYYWPKPAAGIISISAPLLRFAETRITGLTTAPIVLAGYYSQTYGAYVHNYMEEFLFEPALEPGLPAQSLAELSGAGIQRIYVGVAGGIAQTFFVISKDDTFRQL